MGRLLWAAFLILFGVLTIVCVWQVYPLGAVVGVALYACVLALRWRRARA